MSLKEQFRYCSDEPPCHETVTPVKNLPDITITLLPVEDSNEEKEENKDE
jgi:hypothetical protein